MAKKEAVTVSKAALVEKVAESTKLNKATVALVTDGIIDEIKVNMKKGNKVTIVNFGTWQVQKVKARKGRNIVTGEEIKIPAHKRVKFTAGKGLNDTVSK